MTGKVRSAVILVMFFFVIVGIALAQTVPQLINYQGKITDSTGQPLADGSTVDLTFAFYGVASGGTAYLTVLQEDVIVTGGIYHVLLGSGAVTPGAESSLAALFQKHKDVWMGVSVDADSEMTPRARISSVPYSMKVDAAWLTAFLNKSDYDGDGFAKAVDGATATTDCNDDDASINPGAAEVCDDGVDNDCDHLVDLDDPNCQGGSTIENMALIPAGCYDMGDSNDSCYYTGECPVHNVCITSSFYMDVHEVTNSEYAACVTGGACTAPYQVTSSTRSSYYGNAAYDNFPVINVVWDQADTYCIWAGKRLPTEAEWEYGSRGGLAGLRYPWGNSITGSNANFYDSGDPWDNDTSQAQYYPANGYGLYDMVGNVFEYVNDYYSATYYSVSPVNDPPGPASGSTRVVRGGTWGQPSYYLRNAFRFEFSGFSYNDQIGFRCAKD